MCSELPASASTCVGPTKVSAAAAAASAAVCCCSDPPGSVGPAAIADDSRLQELSLKTLI